MTPCTLLSGIPVRLSESQPRLQLTDNSSPLAVLSICCEKRCIEQQLASNSRANLLASLAVLLSQPRLQLGNPVLCLLQLVCPRPYTGKDKDTGNDAGNHKHKHKHKHKGTR